METDAQPHSEAPPYSEAQTRAEGQTYPEAQPQPETPQPEGQPYAEAPPQYEAPRSTGVEVEIVMESFRVSGQLFAPGVPRRLVDILNSNDLAYFTMTAGTLDDPFDTSTETRTFDVIQLDRGGILFAIPRGEVHKPDPFEVVRKKQLLSTVVLPGFRLSGNLYLMPEADPMLIPIVSDHHFVPFTDVTVTAEKGRSQAWHEPLLIVNMGRALFFGTTKAGGPA